MTNLLSSLVDFAQNLTVSLGYGGVFTVAVLENFFPPLPSELIFPFAGFIAGQGRFQLLPVILAGTFGALVGAWFWYGLGYWLGRANIKSFLDRYGRFLRVHLSDVERAEKWFARFEGSAVFLGRLAPLVRTLISVPAGFVKMPLLRFSLYTFIGSFLWIGLLSLAGFIMGENWLKIVPFIQNYELLIEIGMVLFAIGFGVWIYRHRHR